MLRKLRSSNTDLAVKKHYERITLVLNEYVLKHRNLPPGFTLTLIVKHAPEIPHQSNGYDCGVFLLEFMKYITMKKPFNFSCSDMTHFRQELTREFEFKLIGNTLERPIFHERTQSLPQSKKDKLKSENKEKMLYSNIAKEAKVEQGTISDTFQSEKPIDGQVICKIIRFDNPSRKNLCF